MLTIFDEEDAKNVLAELEAGRDYEEIFSKYPRFAFHEFQELLAKNAGLKKLHANVLKYRAMRDRDAIRGIAGNVPSKDEVPGARLQFDVLKHLSSHNDHPDLSFLGEEDGIAAHMVVFIPKRQPAGLVARVEEDAIDAEVLNADAGQHAIDSGDDSDGDDGA